MVGVITGRQRGLKDSRRDRPQVRCRFFEGPVRFQAADHRQPPVVARVEVVVLAPKNRLRADGKRHVEGVAHIEAEETRGCYA